MYMEIYGLVQKKAGRISMMEKRLRIMLIRMCYRHKGCGQCSQIKIKICGLATQITEGCLNMKKAIFCIMLPPAKLLRAEVRLLCLCLKTEMALYGWEHSVGVSKVLKKTYSGSTV